MSATPDSTFGSPEQLVADLQRQLAEREVELAEAREQQTATAEVLQVINSSPGDLAPVFDAMLDKMMSLCEAAHGHFLVYDGALFHPGGFRGEERFGEIWRQGFPFRPEPASPQAQLLRCEHLVHMPDASALHGPGWDGPRTRAAREAGLRPAHAPVA